MRKLALAFACATLALPAAAQQDYPNKEVKVVIGFDAGTGADIIARYYADKVAPLMGKPTVVENKSGAFGMVAADSVVRSKPDGYTIMVTASSVFVLNPFVLKQVTFDPLTELAPVTTLHRQAFMLVVDPKLPIKTVAELTEHLKKKGESAAFGAPNAFSEVAGELYKIRTGTNARIVRYRQTPQAATEMLDGALDFIFADMTFAIEQVKTGRLRPLAVTMGQRAEITPDVPTMQEAGVPNFDLMGWFAISAPAKTPKPILDKLEGWFNRVVALPETKQFLFNMGNEPHLGGQKVLGDFVRSENAKWRAIIQEAKIEPR